MLYVIVLCVIAYCSTKTIDTIVRLQTIASMSKPTTCHTASLVPQNDNSTTAINAEQPAAQNNQPDSLQDKPQGDDGTRQPTSTPAGSNTADTPAPSQLKPQPPTQVKPAADVRLKPNNPIAKFKRPTNVVKPASGKASGMMQVANNEHHVYSLCVYYTL